MPSIDYMSCISRSQSFSTRGSSRLIYSHVMRCNNVFNVIIIILDVGLMCFPINQTRWTTKSTAFPFCAAIFIFWVEILACSSQEPFGTCFNRTRRSSLSSNALFKYREVKIAFLSCPLNLYSSRSFLRSDHSVFFLQKPSQVLFLNGKRFQEKTLLLHCGWMFLCCHMT